MGKRKLTKSIVILMTFSLILVLSACGGTGETGTTMSNNGTMNKGDMAPMFALSDLDGNQVQLAELNGKKVYVKFWASWCTICLAGLEELNTLAGQDNEFQVITIVTPKYKGEKSAKDFTEWFTKQPYDNLTVLFDEGGDYAKKFGLRGYPSSFYIGSDGILVKASPGHVNNEGIIASFEEII